MLGLQHYNPGSPEGIFEPEQARYLHNLISQTGREFKEVLIVSAENIMLPVSGDRYGFGADFEQSLQEYLEPFEDDSMRQIPSGLCAWFEGTWAEAKALKGWVIRDGSNGTTDMLTDQRFIRSVAEGSDSGTEGGAADHTHAEELTVAAHSHTLGTLATASAGAHNHTGLTGMSNLECTRCRDSGVASTTPCNHKHCIGPDGAHTHTMEGALADSSPAVEGTITASSHEPLNVAMIPIMKL